MAARDAAFRRSRPCDEAREAAIEEVEPGAPPAASICARRKIWSSWFVRPSEVSGIEEAGEAMVAVWMGSRLGGAVVL